MKSLLRLVVVSMLGCFAIQARTQTSSATISGHVVDQSNGAVPNAQVVLTNQQTNVVVTTHTNGSGDFIFPDRQPGTFSIAAKAAGYKELKQVGLVLSASQNLSTGTLTLQVGAVTESVTVSAAITPLQTTSSERSGVLDSTQVDNLSTLGRDVMGLLQTLPGVYGGGGSSTLGTTGTPTVNGVLNEYNLVTVDGVTANTRGLSTMDDEINQDAVQQISLLGSNYQAAYGKTAGANITYVTKSGTNKFHGVLYYYFRNEDLNANSFFNKFTHSPYIARARYRYNTAGGTLGGPIYWPGHFNQNKDKLFFFVSFEDDPTITPDGVKSYRIPTQAEIGGDFSQTYSQGKTTNIPVNIKIPGQSAASCASTGTPGSGCFPGNKIPLSLIDPQMQILQQIIHDNTLGAQDPTALASAPKGGPGFYVPNNPAVTSNNYNYQTNNSAHKPVKQLIFRVDYSPTQSLHMFGRGDLTTVDNTGYASTANNLPWLISDDYQTKNPNFVYNIVYTFSPKIVNEFNVGAAGWYENTVYS
ncbi:MAG: carboxypeptidase-like regulatory domain-containing protein, partial [Acidobacteriota bacterium]|nr:carboxypeptidase-like regulatory domain-containing protein [Acidobacteriota bacterium]